MNKLIKLIAGAAMLAAAPVAGFAGDYPEKPVSIINPWAPGDLEDLLSRMIADEFEKEYGVAAAVVNKPSGGGGPFPGAAEVAKAASDGYTIGSFPMGVPIAGPYVGIDELNPNPFEPVGVFLTYPFVIATGKDAPYKNIEELAKYSQDNKVVLGHYGGFLVPTQITFAHAKRAGINFASDAAYDVLDCNSIKSGDVDVMNTTIPAILPCIDDITILYSITEERTKFAPDAPTMKELYPDLNVTLWHGLFVKKDVSQDARDKIAAVAEKAMAGDDARALAERTGAGVYWQGAEESQKRQDADAATIAAIRKENSGE